MFQKEVKIYFSFNNHGTSVKFKNIYDILLNR